MRPCGGRGESTAAGAMVTDVGWKVAFNGLCRPVMVMVGFLYRTRCYLRISFRDKALISVFDYILCLQLYLGASPHCYVPCKAFLMAAYRHGQNVSQLSFALHSPFHRGGARSVSITTRRCFPMALYISNCFLLCIVHDISIAISTLRLSSIHPSP